VVDLEHLAEVPPLAPVGERRGPVPGLAADPVGEGEVALAERLGALEGRPALDPQLEVGRPLRADELRHQLLGELELDLVPGLEQDRGEGLRAVGEIAVELRFERPRHDHRHRDPRAEQDEGGAAQQAPEEEGADRLHRSGPSRT
jgi:hypothetical protein